MGPFPQDDPHSEKSGLFLYLNANKRGITLDVATSTGYKLLLELIERSDVLVENHLPQEMAAMGLTYDRLRQANPRLVMTSISPFGQDGPYSHFKSSELVCFQMSGVGYETPNVTVTDPEHQQPLKGGGHLGPLAAGWQAAVSTMVAMFHRRGTGLGQHVDVTEQEALASTVRPKISQYSYEGHVRGRVKESFAYVLPCKDGYVNIAGSMNLESHWAHLMQAMDSPEWAQSELFATREGRRENYDALEMMIEPWLMEHTKGELFELAQRYDFMLFPSNNVDEVYANDQYRVRQLFQQWDHPVAGAWPYPRTPFLLSATPPRFYWPAPLLGEHNRDVYCQWLGHSKDELVALRQLGVI